jgi:hypothetical protein
MSEELFIEIGKHVVDILIRRGYVNKLSIRNQEIRKKYAELRAKGMNAKTARAEILKEPYHFFGGEAQYLSERNLIKILYEEKKP